MGGTPADHSVVRAQAFWWTQHANLAFEFGGSADPDIRVAFDRNECAWSFVGTDAKRIPPDQPTMNLGFLDGGIAAHEFGHAIGLGHVSQNPSGGIEWNEAALLEDLSGPPMYWSAEQIRQMIVRKYSTDWVLGPWFDPDSIMLPTIPRDWNGTGIEGNAVLSRGDERLAVSMYPRQ